MGLRDWNWGNILIVIFLIVILSLEVVNYIHIQNNAVQLKVQLQDQNQVVQDTMKNIVNNTEILENFTEKAIKDVSNNCVSVFKDILSH